MQKMSFGLNLLIWLALLLSSGCATVKAPDEPICLEFDVDRGRCIHIISGKKFDWDETHKFQDKTWWEQRPYMVLVPASSWSKIKIFIVQICKKTNMCDQSITNWERTVETIDAELDQKLP